MKFKRSLILTIVLICLVGVASAQTVGKQRGSVASPLAPVGEPMDLGPIGKYVVSRVADGPTWAKIRFKNSDDGRTWDYAVPANVSFVTVSGAVGYVDGQLIILEAGVEPKVIDAITGNIVASPESLVGADPTRYPKDPDGAPRPGPLPTHHPSDPGVPPARYPSDPGTPP